LIKDFVHYQRQEEINNN